MFDNYSEEPVAKPESTTKKYLSFDLGGKIYGVPISDVKEIMEYQEVNHVPMMPSFVLGAINLRGDIINVIDLSARLGGLYREPDARTCIVIIEFTINDKKLDVGLKVDSVKQVVDIDNSEIDTAPSLGGQIPTDFIYGVGKLDDNGFIVLLNVSEILKLTEFDRLLPASSHDNTVEQASEVTAVPKLDSTDIPQLISTDTETQG